MNYRKLFSRKRMIGLLQDLVAIPSVNPAFSDGQGEQKIAQYIEQYFAARGIAHVQQLVMPDRPNVIATVEGQDKTRGILLEAHMDTVQIVGMSIDPFGAVIEDGRLYGRGACDTKASLATMMLTLDMFREHGIVPPVSVHLAAVVDEEVLFRGVAYVADQVEKGLAEYEAAIVGEPTGLAVVIAHKGCVRFSVDVRGVASHSSTPERGVNAIEKMYDVVRALGEEITPAYARSSHRLVGPPTLCISTIHGGVGANTVPESCQITIDRRTVPGEDSHAVWKGIKERLESLGPAIGAEVRVGDPFVLDYSMETAPNERIARAMLAAGRKYGYEGPPIGVPYGTDASKLARVGIPSIVFGPGSIEQAHTHDEWVDLDEVESAVCMLADAIMSYGGNREW